MPYYITRANSADSAVERNRFYSLLLGLTIIGHGWVTYHLYSLQLFESFSLTICPFKAVTGFPCPSCGSTRSVLLLLQGHFQEALLLNPLGVLMALSLIGLPIWALTDFLFSKPRLYTFYLQLEEKVKKEKTVYLPLILLFLMNWTWNIIKGL